MDIFKEGNMGVPTHLDIWVDIFYSNTISLIKEFVNLGRSDPFYLDKEQTIKSYSINFSNGKEFNSTIFNNESPKLKNLSIELDIYSVPKEHFSIQEWTAHYNDSTSELKGDTLYSAEIYFEFFIPEEIFDVEDIESYLYETNLKSYLMEYISHELTHMYEFYMRKVNHTDINWKEKKKNLVHNLMNEYLETVGMKKISSSWSELMYLKYMSTGFEINARVVQLYFRVKYSSDDINSYEDFKNNIKESLVNKELESMKQFDPVTWYENFTYNENLVDAYLSNQEWITDDIRIEMDVKDLVLKSLLIELDYIIERLNVLDKDIKRMPIQHIDNPLLFLNDSNKRIKRYYNKLNNKIVRLYNKFL